MNDAKEIAYLEAVLTAFTGLHTDGLSATSGTTDLSLILDEVVLTKLLGKELAAGFTPLTAEAEFIYMAGIGDMTLDEAAGSKATEPESIPTEVLYDIWGLAEVYEEGQMMTLALDDDQQYYQDWL